MKIERLSMVVAAALLLGSLGLPAPAEQWQAGVSRNTVNTKKTFLQKHPVAKKAMIGGGTGAAAGAVTGLVSGKGTLRGAAYGAAAGTGVGLIQSSKTLKRHPVIKDVATGTTVGLGLGLAASKGEGTGKRVGIASGIGAAAGLGTSLLKNEFR